MLHMLIEFKRRVVVLISSLRMGCSQSKRRNLLLSLSISRNLKTLLTLFLQTIMSTVIRPKIKGVYGKKYFN